MFSHPLKSLRKKTTASEPRKEKEGELLMPVLSSSPTSFDELPKVMRNQSLQVHSIPPQDTLENKDLF